MTSSETADDYSGLVAPLNLSCRVVVTRDGTQWILQRRRANGWSARSHCRTRAALERCAGLYGVTSIRGRAQSWPRYRATLIGATQNPRRLTAKRQRKNHL